jgi:hypothetical protein
MRQPWLALWQVMVCNAFGHSMARACGVQQGCEAGGLQQGLCCCILQGYALGCYECCLPLSTLLCACHCSNAHTAAAADVLCVCACAYVCVRAESKVELHGLQAFDAAVYCASLTAAERLAAAAEGGNQQGHRECSSSSSGSSSSVTTP